MASSTIKQHIVTALDEGIEAGFDSWYESLVQNTNDGRNGLPQLRTLLADVKKVGKKRGRPTNRAKQIEFYCNKYADDLAAVTTTPEPTPTTDTPDVNTIAAAVAQAIAAALGGTTVTVPESEIEAVEDEDDDEDERPTYSGKDPDAPATSGQLWRLNTLGHFGDVITKAEAFDLIADAIDEA